MQNYTPSLSTAVVPHSNNNSCSVPTDWEVARECQKLNINHITPREIPKFDESTLKTFETFAEEKPQTKQRTPSEIMIQALKKNNSERFNKNNREEVTLIDENGIEHKDKKYGEFNNSNVKSFIDANRVKYKNMSPLNYAEQKIIIRNKDNETVHFEENIVSSWITNGIYHDKTILQYSPEDGTLMSSTAVRTLVGGDEVGRAMYEHRKTRCVGYQTPHLQKDLYTVETICKVPNGHKITTSLFRCNGEKTQQTQLSVDYINIAKDTNTKQTKAHTVKKDQQQDQGRGK